MNPIDKPDVTNEDPMYWEEVLASHGLSMKVGSRPNFVQPIGTINNLAVLENKEFSKSTGKVTPKGHSPDKD